MLRIGITGGIGSGKTTICKLFETLGINVYYADDRAKWLMQHDPPLKTAITEEFGEAIYSDDGTLNRKLLASIVFKDRDRLKKLEALVHPKVFEDGVNWWQEHADAPYTLRENALLFETGSYKMMDKTITVFAPEELRIKRVMNRDKVNREAVEDRISKQMDDAEKMKLADFIIYNDEEKPLIKQVYNLHEKLVNLSKDVKEEK